METVAPSESRRRGRQVTDPRDKFVAVRCTGAEHAALSAASAQAGLSVGAYLRAAALGNPGIRSVRRPPVERKELARALGLIGLYGSNLNQLARVANSQGDLPARDACEQLAREVHDIRNALMRALGRGD